MHVALVVVALAIVGGFAGLVYFIQKGGLSRSQQPIDPAEVLAELQKVGASVQYDNTPEKNVISVSLASLDFPAALLGKLRAFPKLERLDLQNCRQLNDGSAAVLAGFKQLKVLDVKGSGIGEKSVAMLKAALPETQVLY